MTHVPIDEISQISACTACQGGLGIWYGLERPVITPKIGNWSISVLRLCRFCIADNHENGRGRVRNVRCLETIGCFSLNCKVHQSEYYQGLA